MIVECNLRVTGRSECAVLKNAFEILKQYGTVKTSGIDGDKNFYPFFFLNSSNSHVSSHLRNKYLSRTNYG